MLHRKLYVRIWVALLCSAGLVAAQQAAPGTANAVVPPMIKFNGVLTDVNNRPLTGAVGVTFSLYKDTEGGAALWVETQNVTPDKAGHYTALLGSTTSQGLPASLFNSAEARWLGVRINGSDERPRVLLLSVPYALKAADAETLDGMPASAFLQSQNNSPAGNSNGAKAGVGGNGKANFIPIWKNSANLGDSVLFQKSGNIGVGTTSPAALLDVTGTGGFHDTLTLFPNSSHAALSVQGTNFAVSSAGLVNFVSGQSFPGTGTITGVTAGTDLTGGGTSGNVTLRLDTTKVPQLNAANTFTGNQTVNGNLGATGVVTGSGYQIGSNLFAFGNYANGNAFLGFAGNTTTTGTSNTASGVNALFANTTGTYDTAIGAYALLYNTTGSFNTATGFEALLFNTTGSSNTATGNGALAENTTGGGNTATGFSALGINTTGSENTASGYEALFNNTTGQDNTASGTEALVDNQTGSYNTASGAYALADNLTGVANSAFGYFALANNNNGTGGGNGAFGYQALDANTTGSNNDAFGGDALLNNTTGSNNIAFGGSALYSLTSGNNNIAVGNIAGVSLTTGSNNIYIGNRGVSSESNVIRLGSNQTSTYIPGIYGATSGNGIEVFVNSLGQLGTYTSSRRFKYEITDMGTESEVLMKLRPVSFYYKPELDPSHTRQYGLVAEEVAQIAPQLVAYDKDGQPETVRYHAVNAMLLNQVQKQQTTIAQQQSEIARVTQQMAAQREQIRLLRGRLRSQDALLQARLAKLEGNVNALRQAQGLPHEANDAPARLAKTRETTILGN